MSSKLRMIGEFVIIAPIPLEVCERYQYTFLRQNNNQSMIIALKTTVTDDRSTLSHFIRCKVKVLVCSTHLNEKCQTDKHKIRITLVLHVSN
jgi:hypothetical protein